MWTAAIIAGGQARRFGGRDKASLLVGGVPILQRQLTALRGLVDHVIIVADDRERFGDVAVPVIPDLTPGAGSLGGVYSAVSQAPDDRTFAIACDMPFVEPRLVARLLEAGDVADIAVPHGASGWQPLCATYSRACVPELRVRAETGRLTLADFITSARGLRVTELGADDLAAIGDEDVLFFNVNSPEDHTRAEDIERKRRA
jgi:molybdopterin-guanine dinucleotide biosynthesis protein A